MKNSLIIPAYNEALVIRSTLCLLLATFDEQKGDEEWEIIVVDNASDDRTGEVADSLKDMRVRVLKLSQKGKGRAVREGFAAAFGEIVGFTDADLSIDPHEIIDAFRLVKDDPTMVIVGSRFHNESYIPDREWWRTLSSHVFNHLARTIVGVVSTDTQCPLKVMHRDMLRVMLSTKENTWFFDLEFLSLCDISGKKVKEIGINWSEHRYPLRKSKLSVKDTVAAIFAMFRIRIRNNIILTSKKDILKISSMQTGMRSWVIMGLGNPGEEYVTTRHNVGRIALDQFRKTNLFPEWEFMRTSNALVSKGSIEDTQVLLVTPETYMNHSGDSVQYFVKNLDEVERLIVIHDDIDLALGSWKVSWDRNDGGHNGLRSIIETLKTKKFLRIRIGVLPLVNGIKQKPKGKNAVAMFVIGKFRLEESGQLAPVLKEIVSTLKEILTLTPEEAMNKWN